MAYGADILTGGTPSADNELGAGYEADKGCDNNESTRWTTADLAPPHWWKYDLGSGVTKTVRKLRIITFYDANGALMKDFTLQGSNNDSDYTVIYTGQQANNGSWQEYTFANDTAYRYYKINITTHWRSGDNYTGFFEAEMMELLATGGAFLVDFL